MQQSRKLLLIVIDPETARIVKTNPDTASQLARERTNYTISDGDSEKYKNIRISNIVTPPFQGPKLPRELHNCLRDTVQAYVPGGRRPSYLSDIKVAEAVQSKFGSLLPAMFKSQKIGRLLKCVLATGGYLAIDTNLTLSNYSWMDRVEDWFIKTIRSRSLSSLTKTAVNDADTISRPYLRQVLFPLVDNMSFLGWDMDQFSSKIDAPELIQRLIRRTEEPSASARVSTYDTLKQMYLDDLIRYAEYLIREDSVSYLRLRDLMRSYGIDMRSDPTSFTRKSRCAPPEIRYAITRDVATLIALRRLLRNSHSIRDNGYLPSDASLNHVNAHIGMSFCQTFNDVIPQIRRGDFKIINHPFVVEGAAQATDIFSHLSSDDEVAKRRPAISLAATQIVDSPLLICPLLYTYFIADYFKAYSTVYTDVWGISCVGRYIK